MLGGGRHRARELLRAAALMVSVMPTRRLTPMR